MSRLVACLALALALAAAGGGALVVLVQPPTHLLELLTLVASERSLFLTAGGLVALVLGLGALRGGAGLPVVSAATGVLALGAVVLGLIPFLASLRVGRERRIPLDFGRYLGARIDTEGPIGGTRTVGYTTVDGRTLGLDVYRPAPASASAPAQGTPPPAGAPAPAGGPALRPILVLHGGGWNAGDKGDASLFSQWLADQGFAVFDVEYRTHPQPNWREALADVRCAIAWVRGHAVAPGWNLDPAAITLLGRSAGAHLALLAGYMAGDDSTLFAAPPPSCGSADTRVAAVIAYYAPTDLPWGYDHPANPRVYDSNDRLRRFIGGPPGSDPVLYRQLSPTSRVTAGAPRTLLIHGGRDQLVGAEHMFRLEAALARQGVEHQTLLLPWSRHAFDFIYGGFSEQLAAATVLRFLSSP